VGQLAHAQSHVKRSSSMSFAMRWKHDNVRYISFFALGAILLTFMFLLMLYGTSTKQIKIIVDGHEQTITTKQWKLENLLIEQSIAIGPHDRLTIPSHGNLVNGDRIEIEHTHALGLIADGRKSIVHTVGNTVQEAIDDLRIQLGEKDRTIPALTATIAPGDTIRIIRVHQMLDKVTKEIPFDIVTKTDGNLAKGKEKVVREGKEGVLVETVENTFEDGVLTSSRVIDTILGTASVDQVIAIGNKKPVTVLSSSSPNVEQVTKKGVTFGVKQILSGVTLTSYDAGPESTGKDVGHPQYGITYSGTKVLEGRTIAVDPKVIPMGWWVYIEGYGFRRAEDKGSAVKGKHIDIYFDDAHKSGIGRKKGVTVYIVGPKKPEVD